MVKKFGKEYRKKLYEQAKKNKRCTSCSRAIEYERRQYLTCLKCSRRHKRNVLDDIDEQTGLERLYKKTMPCSRCRKKFHSPDCRKVTRCDLCRDWMALTEERLPFDQARYDEDVNGTMANLASKPLKPGQKNDSKAYAMRLQQYRAEEHSEMPFRRLSKEEIEARYTPEYCERVVQKANANFAACRHVPTLSQI